MAELQSERIEFSSQTDHSRLKALSQKLNTYKIPVKPKKPKTAPVTQKNSPTPVPQSSLTSPDLPMTATGNEFPDPNGLASSNGYTHYEDSQMIPPAQPQHGSMGPIRHTTNHHSSSPYSRPSSTNAIDIVDKNQWEFHKFGGGAVKPQGEIIFHGMITREFFVTKAEGKPITTNYFIGGNWNQKDTVKLNSSDGLDIELNPGSSTYTMQFK